MNMFDQNSDDKWVKAMFKKFNSQPFKIRPSKFECVKIAATLPNKNLTELMDNTNKIMKWLEEEI